MKTRIIFASMLVVLGLGFVGCVNRENHEQTTTPTESVEINLKDYGLSASYEVTDQALDRIQAVVAYQFSRASLKNDNKFTEFFKEESCPSTINIDDIRNKISEAGKDYKTNKLLVNDIENINLTSNKKNDVIDYFSNGLFEDKNQTNINNFIKKHSDIVSDLKRIINQEVSNVINQDEGRYNVEVKRITDSINNTNNPGNSGNDGDGGGNGIKNNQNGIAWLGVLLGLIGTGLGGYCFWQMRKMQETIRKQKGRVKELRESIINEMENMKREINGLKNEMRNQQNELDDRFAKMNRDNMRAPEAPRGGAQQPAQAAPQRPAAPSEPQTLYAGLPSGDTFTDASPRNTNKSFYKIDLRGSNNGEYEFISNPTTINYAKSSTTQFIECACNIVDNANGFSNVVTTRKGKVEKSGNDWKIVQKAEVRLS